MAIAATTDSCMAVRFMNNVRGLNHGYWIASVIQAKHQLVQK